MIAAKTARRRNVRGKSGDPNRGTWCTPLRIANAIGRFFLDPFSNPRDHIVAQYHCMLERGEDGFGDGTPGSFTIHDEYAGFVTLRTTADDRVFIQPPYSIVQQALDHYGHTRFCALLRFDPRPKWFHRIYAMSSLVCVLRHCNFEPPPGVKASSNTFPHALFYRCADDVTDDVLRLCISWRRQSHG